MAKKQRQYNILEKQYKSGEIDFKTYLTMLSKFKII